jgi:hypothetical protein
LIVGVTGVSKLDPEIKTVVPPVVTALGVVMALALGAGVL